MCMYMCMCMCTCMCTHALTTESTRECTSIHINTENTYTHNIYIQGEKESVLVCVSLSPVFPIPPTLICI